MEYNTFSAVDSATLGKNIRNARLAMGYTIDDLAEKLGLSWSYIGLIERGERCPSLRTLMEICKIFSLTPDELIYGTSQLHLSAKGSKQNKILKIKAIINQFSDDELDFIAEIIKQVAKVKIHKE